MKKHSYNHVKKYIEGFGYRLVSKEYKNNGTKLELVCPEGHSFEMNYHCFHGGYRCPVCAGNKKYSYNQVKEYINIFGYQLVSKEYKNANTKMEMVCPVGHSFEMTYSHFQNRQRRCPECFGNKKLSYGKIKIYIEGFGYKLVSKEYKNVKTKLKMICPEGHNFEMKYNNFQQGQRCPTCFGAKKISFDYVKEYIEGFGYKLVSKEYKNAHIKLKLICTKNHYTQITYGNFQQGKRCSECAKYLVTSKGEKDVLNFVQSVYDGKIIENDRTQIINPFTGRYLELDIWLPELNKAIEYNSEWWHKDRKKIDELKQTLCSEKGIELLVIEEKEWTENRNFVQVESFIF